MAAGSVFPSLINIRKCSLNVAISCAQHALDLKIARTAPGRGEELEGWVERKMYYPEYTPIYTSHAK